MAVDTKPCRRPAMSRCTSTLPRFTFLCTNSCEFKAQAKKRNCGRVCSLLMRFPHGTGSEVTLFTLVEGGQAQDGAVVVLRAAVVHTGGDKAPSPEGDQPYLHR